MRFTDCTIFLPIAAAAVIVSSSTCAAAQSKTSDSGPLVSLEWLHDHLSDPHVVLFDVSVMRQTYDAGHIRGARYLDHGVTSGANHDMATPAELATRLGGAGARDDARIVLYGDHPMATGWMFMAFVAAGHGDHASLLDGNLRAWRAAGYPISTANSTGEGRLTAKTSPPPPIVDGPWVHEHLKDATMRLFDVRAEDEWSKGMIPGAVRFRWQDLYADLEQARFKSPEEIRRLFEAAGLREGQTAVTYCAVGMRASLAYFAARAAGVPARVYLGSWADWSNRYAER
jgi:thiosulfate/3-mercaptopyruvate sulfurtransferase